MDAIALLRLALSILTERLLVILSLVMVFVLACWTMYLPGYVRLEAMALFAVFSLILLKGRKKENNGTIEE
jgi:hypothetical protein